MPHAAILNSVDLLTAIVDGSQDGIVANDVRGDILSWNPAATAMFGYSEEEAVGSAMQHMVPIDAERLQRDVFLEVYAGRRVEHYETVCVGKDGSPMSVSLNVSPLIDQSGEIVGACTIIRDITDRIVIETERERARLALELSHQALAHDLRGPLGMTAGMIEEARSRAGDAAEACAPFLALADDCIAQMKMLVDDVGLLHSVHSPEERVPLDVAALMAQAAASIDSVELSVDDLPPVILAHERAMLRMFRNIFENAGKHARGAEGRARVRVSGREVGDFWELDFDDEGPGIADAELVRVFDPFYRGADRGDLDGTGLGLAIVDASAAAHGGGASASNLDGRGLRISVRLAKWPNGVFHAAC